MIDPSLFTPPYNNSLCIALIEAGCDVTLYTRKRRPSDFPIHEDVPVNFHFYRVSEAVRQRIGTGKIFLSIKAIEHVANCVQLLLELRRSRPDVIHFQWTPIPFVDWLFVRMASRIGPVVLTVHDTELFHNEATNSVQRFGWEKVLRHAEHLVVHVRSTVSKLSKIDNSLAEKVVVIPHGIFDWSGEYEKLSGAEIGASKARGVSDEKVCILMFGRMAMYKGVDILWDAWNRLDERIREASQLVFVGPAVGAAKQLLAEISLLERSNVIVRDEFLPEEELQAYLTRSDIVVFPYREIDSSGALMTAMNVDTAILLSDLPTFLDVVDDHQCAHSFSSEDSTDLARQLMTLVNSSKKRENLIDNLKLARIGQLSWKSIGEATAEFYSSIRDKKL